MDNFNNTNNKPWGMEENAFCMLMHLSQFAGYLIPFAGLVLPIVMWATNKDENETVDKHGKVILNWMISSLLYAVICGILVLLVIGFIGLIALGVCSIIFIIVGAVKASSGELYEYPLSIKFFA